MLKRLSGFGVCAGLLGATLAWSPANAASQENNTFYSGEGLLYGLSGVVDRFQEATIVRDGPDGDAVMVKGEFRFSEDGALLGGEFEGAQVQVQISTGPNEVHNLVVQLQDQQRVFGLSEVAQQQSADSMSVEGVVIDDSLSTDLVIFLYEPSVNQGAAPNSASLGIGPDVTASRVGLSSSGSGSDDFAYYGTANGIRAFSIASTSCNIGNQTAEWISGNSGRHPLIGQNVFRFQNGRFEHIGQSWLKHSFCAVSEPTCGECAGTPCSSLGIGCADTYWATLNDGQGGGAKADINPQGFGTTGGIANTHSHPYTTPSQDPFAIRGRLQIHDADILAGGQFFAEIQYVTHDEDLDVRGNNASWREINLSLTSMSGVGAGQASVHFQEPAIQAWDANDTSATVRSLNVPGEGKSSIWYGYSANDNGDGTWRYEYAIHNLHSDRGVGSFSVPIPGVTVSNVGFADVDYHSGEPYDGTDWGWEIVEEDGTTVLRWSTQTFEENQNANAIRWGTLYNFYFDANSAPLAQGQVTLGLFKPGAVPSVSTVAGVPEPLMLECVGDIDGSGDVGPDDLAAMLGNWGPNPGHPADINGDGNVGSDDLALLLGNWGPCP